MYLNGTEQVGSQAEAAMASMQSQGVLPTPSNFSVWYAYHSGQNSELTRTIDVLLSNSCPIDDQTLDQLRGKFFKPPISERALCDKTIRARDTLKTVLDLVEKAKNDADGIGVAIDGISAQFLANVHSLADLIDSLVEETSRIVGRSERLGFDLKQSSDKIDALERTLEDLRREATTDGLTGIANRRYFDIALQTMSGDAMNSGDDLSLLLIDIDHFKMVNDTYGHLVGDKALRAVTDGLRSQLRSYDLAGRFGGEEFVVLLPQARETDALNVAERLRAHIAGLSIPVSDTDESGPCVKLTISVGVAALDDVTRELTDMVAAADAALYYAKETGRNKTHMITAGARA
jgi:diguanylate cyclase